MQQGSSITLYAPFTSYGRVPTVQWRKNGTNISGATSYYQITDTSTCDDERDEEVRAREGHNAVTTSMRTFPVGMTLTKSRQIS